MPIYITPFVYAMLSDTCFNFFLIHISWHKVALGKKRLNEMLSPSPRGDKNKIVKIRGLLLKKISEEQMG